jgi:hypothetical protein
VSGGQVLLLKRTRVGRRVKQARCRTKPAHGLFGATEGMTLGNPTGRPPIDFSDVDWKQTTKAIALQLGCSGETVRARRKELFGPQRASPKHRRLVQVRQGCLLPRPNGEDYYEALLKFREWCAAKDTPFTIEARKALLAWVESKGDKL